MNEDNALYFQGLREAHQALENTSPNFAAILKKMTVADAIKLLGEVLDYKRREVAQIKA